MGNLPTTKKQTNKQKLFEGLSYLTVTNPWNVSLFLGCWLIQGHSGPSSSACYWVFNWTHFIPHRFFRKKAVQEQMKQSSHYQNMSVRMMHEHCTLSLKDLRDGNAQLLTSRLCALPAFLNLRNEKRIVIVGSEVLIFCGCLRVGWSCRWPSRRRWRWGKPVGKRPWRSCLSSWLCPQTFSSWRLCPLGLLAVGLKRELHSWWLSHPWLADTDSCCSQQNWSGLHVCRHPEKKTKQTTKNKQKNKKNTPTCGGCLLIHCSSSVSCFTS